MLLKQIFDSRDAWRKLSKIAIQPVVAYKVLKYIKLLNAEHTIINEQHVALICKITNTKDIKIARIEPDTQEFTEYVEKFNEILSVESTLGKFDSTFEEMLAAIIGDSTLTVQDLAILEPFFVD